MLTGEREALVLDLFGPGGAPHKRPEQFLSFLGMELNEELKLTEVMADSKASEAGLRVGDQLLELDGVRLESPDDPDRQRLTALQKRITLSKSWLMIYEKNQHKIR